MILSEVVFMITFNPLWQTLKIKGITTYKLEHQYGMSKSMIHKLKHNQSITLQTLNQLCAMLDCNITDIIPTLTLISFSSCFSNPF